MGSLRSSMQYLLTGITRGCGALLQAVPVPDGSFTSVISHFEILRQFQSVRGAGAFAQPAKHATRSVVSEVRQHFSAGGIVSRPSDDDKIFRARQRAQIAADTKRFAGFRIVIQARRAAVPLGDHGPLEGILFGDDLLRILHPEGDGKAFDEINLE